MTFRDTPLPQPAVSIVLPTFNRSRLLRATVESVRAQTFTDWELIIADDGSGEETREYLGTLEREPRVKLVWLAHTGRPAIVRNAALREATGHYVAFVDSDDLWEPRKLTRQLDALGTRPDRRWCYTAFSQIDEAGNRLAEEERRRWVPHEGAIFEHLVSGKASLRTPAVLAARDLVAKVGGFDERMPAAEDYDLWMRLALESEVTLVDEPLVKVRRHGENFSHAWQSAFAGRDHSLEKLQTQVDSHTRALLRTERVRNAVKLAATHASLGENTRAFRALRRSFPYSWRYQQWWLGALKILLRPRVSHRLLGIYRAHRGGA